MMRRLFAALIGLALAGMSAASGMAAEPVRIGLILPFTGQSASTGRQIEAAARLYLQQNGDSVAGRKIELVVKDDTGTADVTKRLAQELVVRDKVDFLAGFGLTPLALAAAPIATQAKKPMLVMAAATATITEASPFIVRTSFTLPQVTIGIARWSSANGIKKVATLVTDYAPGADAQRMFKSEFAKGGGEVVAELTVPLRSPDFAPVLQRAKDAAPDALFVFVPSGAGGVFIKQFAERGLAEAGIRLIATGDVTDDDLLDGMGDAALGVVNSHHYSAAHNSPENKAFVAGFTKATSGMRPNFMAVGGYDGMHVIVQALKRTEGRSDDGTALVEAMKGMAWESPRGPVTIDPATRDIIQNVYIRKVEKVDGHLWNVEFDKIEAVKDPIKAGG